MKQSVTLLALAVVLAGGRGGGAAHEKGGESKDVAVFTPKEIRWADAPAVFPRGAQVAALEGDPAKEGPFVLRIKMPDGYRIAPHTHPKVERVTVISGTFYLGMGKTFDTS